MNAYHVSGVAAAALEALLSQSSEPWPWFYGERSETTELFWLEDVLSTWQQWTYGRVFGPQSELVWWQRGNGRYDLRLLTDGPPPAVTDFSWGQPAAWEAHGEAGQTLLHGQLDEDRTKTRDQATWSEARIPRWLAYPLKTEADNVPKRVILTTQTYAQAGIVGFTRLLSVDSAPGNSQRE